MAQTAAIIGSGNIGTDLMHKLTRRQDSLRLVALVGIDPESDGLAKARALGIEAIHTGVDGLIDSPLFDDLALVFDATSARAHQVNHDKLTAAKPGIRLIDLTPAAIGPFCVPAVNLDEHLDAQNLNMVTCGGQATVPIVAAVSKVTKVHYAEIVASISSRSAGPGTRANIDEFTETTAEALSSVGGATHGKALIILNPAEPPALMRDTVYALCDPADRDAIEASIVETVERVAAYVPGYRLKQQVQFDVVEDVRVPVVGQFSGLKVSVFLEVEGAADYLPAFAGNLDIMTSAAVQAASTIAQRLEQHAGV
jgi:acetaldehyde dehydrogenase